MPVSAAHGRRRAKAVSYATFLRRHSPAATAVPAKPVAKPSCAPVAQWIEYCPPKAGVAGSIPAGRANFPQLCHAVSASRRGML
ncbi:hypothetical protein CBM2586_A10077 [Cupriavidus phytorum]|uniref:Uncharacterized protein n=1 Tax=Cupriavidus taiwanensis TaxID=164546 RepID=A0A375B8U9_9BURK|nr:hypothetical protein CBM2586_A10077 [Cupriavidus taiwanensis]